MDGNTFKKISIILLSIFCICHAPLARAADWIIETVDSSGICRDSRLECTAFSDCVAGFCSITEDTCHIISDCPPPAQHCIDAEPCLGEKSDTSLELDSNGNPHISYIDQNSQDLKYVHLNETWQIETVESGGARIHYTSLELDENDSPCISYLGGGLKYAYFNDTWQVEMIESGSDVGYFSSLALDSSGNPHISYYDETHYGAGTLKYVYHNGSAWTLPQLIDSGNVGKYTSLALDSGGNPHISYYDETNKDLKYAKFYNNEWHIATVDSDGEVGRYNSLVLDNSDNPHISYYDETSYPVHNLKYAHFDGDCWMIEIVDSDAFAYSTSLALTNNDIPCISYSYLVAVKYAWCDVGGGSGCKWQTNTVSETGGYDVSLALDSKNNPHISYYKNNELKYAFLDHVCEGNFDCDLDVDGTDASLFKSDFGRSGFKNPCNIEPVCNGNFDCDLDVDGTDASLFKSDFGRSGFKNPCPPCSTDPWCVYP